MARSNPLNVAALNAVNVNQAPISHALSSKEIHAELEYECSTSLPTPGVVVKDCLDDCQICEPALEQSSKIELLEKSQEY